MVPSSSQVLETKGWWRKRVGVEPTIPAAKDRINGFEGHEDHRAPGASVVSKRLRILGLLDIGNFRLSLHGRRCYWSVGCDSCHCVTRVRYRQVGIPARHRQALVPEQFRDVAK